jgi:hypothetical protein
LLAAFFFVFFLLFFLVAIPGVYHFLSPVFIGTVLCPLLPRWELRLALPHAAPLHPPRASIFTNSRLHGSFPRFRMAIVTGN